MYTGPFPPDLWLVLKEAWKGGISLQGDFARQHSAEVALAASCGFISNVDPDGRSYRTRWRITAAGLTCYSNKEHFSS
jgi:hypothetical protein